MNKHLSQGQYMDTMHDIFKFFFSHPCPTPSKGPEKMLKHLKQ
jgi:hypothetical protein